jgi:hypothetical protein
MELLELREPSVRLAAAVPQVPRVTLALRAPTGNRARTEQMAGAALLGRQGPMARPALREPKGRKAGRQIARPPFRSCVDAWWVAITRFIATQVRSSA